MFDRILPLALACAAASFAPAVAAQPQQTADGAQRFLALLAKDGYVFVRLPDRNGAAMSVQGTRTTTFRWLKNGVVGNDGPHADDVRPASMPLKLLLGITKIEAANDRGDNDPCTTRLETVVREKVGQVTTEDRSFKKETFFGFDYLTYRTTVTEEFEDPAVKYAGPHYIQWGRAVVSRNAARITAHTPGAKFSTELVFAGDALKDAEMTDRVEYAMKFLKASCDKMAATGF
jgi:hypothetical protein